MTWRRRSRACASRRERRPASSRRRRHAPFGARADAGRHHHRLHARHRPTRRAGLVRDRILPGPRELHAREAHRRLRPEPRHRPAGLRAADRRGHPAHAQDHPRAGQAARRRHRPQHGLPRAQGLPQERRRRPPARPGQDRRTHRGHAAGDLRALHRQDAHRLRRPGTLRRDSRDRRQASGRPPHRARPHRQRPLLVGSGLRRHRQGRGVRPLPRHRQR